MSVSYFQIELRDRATPALRAKMEACSPNRINQAVAHSAALLTKKHLLSLPHNKRGWKPVNFWGQAAASVSFVILVAGVLISISKIGVRQLFQGGHISPVNAKALTIPVAEEAYGKTAADFGDQLKLVVIKGKGAWLALQSFESAGGGLGKAGRKNIQGAPADKFRERLKLLFRLCSGVDQDADPNVLPTDDEYAAEGLKAIEEAVK